MADPALPAIIKTKTLIRGDTRSWPEVFEQNTGTDAAPVWVPLDVSGYTFLMEIREDLNRGTLIATWDIDMTDAATGTIVVTLPSDQADLLPGQSSAATRPVVYCDLQGTRTSDGFRRTFKRWQFKVEGDSSNE